MKKTLKLTESQLQQLIKRKLREQEEEEIDVEIEKNDDMNMGELGSKLLHSQTQSHIFHLQTDSYAEHKALQKYYEGIDGLLDELIEAYQGEHDNIKNYESYPMVSYSGKESVIEFFEDLLNFVRDVTENYPSYLKNVVDEIEVLITSTLYKLRKLS
jgi:hypothetical protein